VAFPLALDRRVPRPAIMEWASAKRAEVQYGVQLRKLARHVGDIVRGIGPQDQQGASLAAEALRAYAEAVRPWAKARARLMVAEIAARTDAQWRKVSAEMGQTMRQVLTGPSVEGNLAPRYAALEREQIARITSIPLEAAERVQHLAAESLIKGTRFTDAVAEIMRQGEVSKAHATMIARTETGAAVTSLVRARSEMVDAQQFVWRTVGDASVRPSHRELNGKSFRWDDPPECDPGIRALPGSSPNCRCWAEPIIPFS
jgi:SPP1 gp7 family putative phage head morphogenesis protein